jgi:hypothetical protein
VGQVNVNTPPGTTTRSEGAGTGMVIGLLVGLLLLALVAWWAFSQSGWFGVAPSTPGGTNVNITTNNPPSGNTSSGSTGSTGSTGASNTGSTGSTGSTGAPAAPGR